MKDTFYIGWMDHAPASTGTAMRRIVTFILLGVCTLAAVIAVIQQHYSNANFEWGQTHRFSGILHGQPLPYLQLDADPKLTEGFGTSAALVAPFKWGLSTQALSSWEGMHVELQATRIYNERQLMLECLPESIRPTSSTRPTMTSSNFSLGPRHLVGEIVDSKCWMGVMNPGTLKPHKACAVRCISGGIPPMLVVRRQNDFPLPLFLVPPTTTTTSTSTSSSFPQNLLPLVAEPVELQGEILVQDGLVFFRFDPASLRRWNPDMTVQARGIADPVCGLH